LEAGFWAKQGELSIFLNGFAGSVKLNVLHSIYGQDDIPCYSGAIKTLSRYAPYQAAKGDEQSTGGNDT
jgi:hypothetical protein